MLGNIQLQNGNPVTVQDSKSIRVGTAGFILEMLAVVLFIVSFTVRSTKLIIVVPLGIEHVLYIGLILYIMGIVLSIVGCFTKPPIGGLTIAGAILSIPFAFFMIWGIVWLYNDYERGKVAEIITILFITIIVIIIAVKITKGENLSFSYKGKVSMRTFFSIGLLISFFIPWINEDSGFDMLLSLRQVSEVGAISFHRDSYLLYLIPVFAAYNIFKDFTKSKKLTLLNEFVIGTGISLWMLNISMESRLPLQLGFYTTAIFSILGLFLSFFSLYKFPALQNKGTGSVQKGMLYQEAGNYSEAFICFYEAAKQNDMIAHNRLGELYEKGLGVEKNINMALKWYEKAAALGDEEAKMRMEILIKRGESEKPDKEGN